ncbi:MAG: DUF433 domain-containing protein [Caldilineales bacterium]|nr:DUF433 domain-containing protein [Caldilineales bacterium]
MLDVIDASYQNKTVERTDHPHVVRVQGVAGGEPIILGTRIMVRTVVEQYQLGNAIEEILWDYPQLSSAQIHDALSYYHDNKEEMNNLLAQASYDHWQPLIEKLSHEYP